MKRLIVIPSESRGIPKNYLVFATGSLDFARDDRLISMISFSAAMPITEVSVPVVSALIGAIILFFGRRLFWLCVAALGFAAGVQLASQLVHEPSALLQLSFAVLLGFIGALLALFLQKLAVALAGFIAGGRLAVGLIATFLVQYTAHYWLIFVIGGMIGALLLLLLFDWALIFISALIGAHLITEAFTLPQTGHVLLFTVLVVTGVIAQTITFRRQGRAHVP